MSLSVKDRWYWFSYNLIRFIVSIPFMPLMWLCSFIGAIKVLFTMDGSEELSFPWEWDWRGELGLDELDIDELGNE